MLKRCESTDKSKMFSTKGLIEATKGLIRAKIASLFPLKV